VRDGVNGCADLIWEIKSRERIARRDPKLLFNLFTVDAGDELVFDRVSEREHVIDRPRVRAGVYVPERDEPLRINVNADLFIHLSAGRNFEVGIRVFPAASGENERARIIPEVHRATTEIDFDASHGVPHKGDSRSRNGLVLHSDFGRDE
jgi:hypothetical protein